MINVTCNYLHLRRIMLASCLLSFFSFRQKKKWKTFCCGFHLPHRVYILFNIVFVFNHIETRKKSIKIAQNVKIGRSQITQRKRRNSIHDTIILMCIQQNRMNPRWINATKRCVVALYAHWSSSSIYKITFSDIFKRYRNCKLMLPLSLLPPQPPLVIATTAHSKGMLKINKNTFRMYM